MTTTPSAPHIGYKLTTAHDTTKGPTLWGPGVEHEAPGKGDLCTDGWIHLYDSREMAEVMDPRHGAFGAGGHLWRVEWWGETKDDHGVKRGAQRVRTVERVERVEVTRNQRIRFAIYCVQAALRGRCPKWKLWAAGWLSGKDRTADAAYAAAYAAYAADAADAAAYAAAYAAYAAAAIDVVPLLLKAIKEEPK